MKDREFAEVSAYIKTKTFVTNFVIDEAVRQTDLAATIDYLNRKTDYNFSTAKTQKHAEIVLVHRLEDEYADIYSRLPTRNVLDILSVRYEFESLRAAFFDSIAFSSDRPIHPAVGNIPIKEYYSFFKHRDPFDSGLPDYLLKPAQDALKKTEEGQTPMRAQITFAVNMFHQMLRLAKETENEFIVNMVQVMIDIHNTLFTLSYKIGQHNFENLEALLIPGGVTSRSFFLSAVTRPLEGIIPAAFHKQYAEEIRFAVDFFERTDDFLIFNHLLRFIQNEISIKGNLIEYGPEIPFTYIMERENEIEIIRMIIYGKNKGMPASRINSYLFLN